MRSWRAVLGMGSEVGNVWKCGKNSSGRTQVWKREGGGMLIDCQIDRGISAVLIALINLIAFLFVN